MIDLVIPLSKISIKETEMDKMPELEPFIFDDTKAVEKQ